MSISDLLSQQIERLPVDQELFSRSLDKIEALSKATDQGALWPEEQFTFLREAGVLGWSIPNEYGGAELSFADRMFGYELLACACLSTAFILSQRDSACRLLVESENEDLKQDWFPLIAQGERFVTVGISHLTTSGQHLDRPLVEAQESADGWSFSGTIPWVTGGSKAHGIVTGGSLPDSNQILCLVQRSDQLRVDQAPKLLALSATDTGRVHLEGVSISSSALIAGPAPKVMKEVRRDAPPTLTPSALALGVARSSVLELELEAERRAGLQEICSSFRDELEGLSQKVRELSDLRGNQESASIEQARQEINSLALRVTQAQLTATKGAGFIAGHKAERAVREALFFLVWACPQPVAHAALQDFACIQ